MNIEQKRLDAIKPYEHNGKVHPQKQIDQLAKSIKAYGFNQPIVVDKEGVIIVGHGRYLAAQQLGIEEVPVVVADLSPEKAKAYRLMDNKSNESDWDMGFVRQELEELKLNDFDLSLTGFEDRILNKNEEGLVGSEEQSDKKLTTCPECGHSW